MMRVELSPRAREQVQRIDDWWRQNRSAGTSFADELAVALGRLEDGESLGIRYPYPLFEVRRFLLAVSRYHVKVLVWHAARGKGPPLR